MATNKKMDSAARRALKKKEERKERKHRKTLDCFGVSLEDFSMGKITINDDYLGKPIG